MSGNAPLRACFRDAIPEIAEAAALLDAAVTAHLLGDVAQAEAFRAWGLPVLGEIVSPGTLEGGDLVWLDEHTVAVGRGYRTNAAGPFVAYKLPGRDMALNLHWSQSFGGRNALVSRTLQLRVVGTW